MNANLKKRQNGLARRHRRVRGKINGTAARPRLCVTRSNSNVYVQVIDDVAHNTICGASTLGAEFKATGKKAATVEGAAALGEIIGKKAIEAGIHVYNRTNGKPIVNSADAGPRISNIGFYSSR